MTSFSRLKTLVFYAASEESSKLSYNEDWADAFRRHPQVDAHFVNLSTSRLYQYLPRLYGSDLIVFLHSTNSNQFYISRNLIRALQFRRAKIAFFVGNEYKLIPEKISLLREIHADWILSQLPQDTAEWLYAECAESKVLSLPHALNPKVFTPEISHSKRPTDIGVRAYRYPWYLGDRERVSLLEFFASSPRLRHLVRDISLDPAKRFKRHEWAGFLNHAKGTVSTEAGASILERDDALRNRVNAFQDAHPEATFGDVEEKFFKDYGKAVSGKLISARHFDAIGTETCQILFPGRYNDILKAGVHYLCLERDFSNLSGVLERFEDKEFRSKMVKETREFVLAAHCHDHRIQRLIDAVTGQS